MYGKGMGVLATCAQACGREVSRGSFWGLCAVRENGASRSLCAASPAFPPSASHWRLLPCAATLCTALLSPFWPRAAPALQRPSPHTRHLVRADCRLQQVVKMRQERLVFPPAQHTTVSHRLYVLQAPAHLHGREAFHPQLCARARVWVWGGVRGKRWDWEGEERRAVAV